jgi:tetratricopeptide (TPR) repeat protein
VLQTAEFFRATDPRFRLAYIPALAVAAALFTRHPASNYIFDEQEALLANPYVNGRGLSFGQVFQRDFWGLPPDRSIGSYRPLPNVIWRVLWNISEAPFVHHFVNVLAHAATAALLAHVTWRVTRDRAVSWLTGAVFVSTAVLTEAVTGVVGIADVFGGLGVVLALAALGAPMAWMPIAVFAATWLSLASKETGLVAAPLVTWAALVLSRRLHARPMAPLRALLAALGATAAVVSYTYFRRRLFPVPSAETIPDNFVHEPWVSRVLHGFLGWFQQPRLPHDPINNPLVDADTAHRIAGALRVYTRGLSQLVLPLRLSGDYSFPAEPIPDRIIFTESVAGAVLLLVPPIVGVLIAIASLGRRALARGAAPDAGGKAALAALALVWVPVSYFPISNIAVLLPTVRAERLWYVPAMGTAMLFAMLGVAIVRRVRRKRRLAYAGVAGFLLVQASCARSHALDYSDDLSFWRATRNATPNSAKAQLNYSVMIGARGQLQERLAVNRRALELAPKWPMAHVYYADALCRAKRLAEAWPYYRRGFELAPGDPNLIALGLQCMWDAGVIPGHHDELLAMADRHPGSWLAYLAAEIVHNGTKHGGVEKRYRPRGYDEGPKD